MARLRIQQPDTAPAADADHLEDELRRLSAAGVEPLRSKWRERHKSDAPRALSKDLIARALAHDLQEKHLGGLEPRLRRLLDRAASPRAETDRHVKIGSVIVREHKGIVHEVMVVPGGFCWQGRVYSSLSIIARRITGTNWNGHRFFGLRTKAGSKETPGKAKEANSLEASPASDASEARSLGRIRRKTGASTL